MLCMTRKGMILKKRMSTQKQFELDLQIATGSENVPRREQFQAWVNVALHDFLDAAELTVRVVDEKESATLNETYRKKTGATNVLSFPFAAETHEYLDVPLLGDIVICVPVLEREASEQGKLLQQHWAHLVIHGCLHLLGYDHIVPAEAQEMEALEVTLLAKLHYPNPYQEDT